MKHYFYSFKRDDANFFLKVQVSDLTPVDAQVNTKRDFVMNAPKYVETGAQNCSFYCVGEFDDDTGIVTPLHDCLITQEESLEILRGAVGNVEFGK